MVIAGKETSRSPMQDSRLKAAGFMSLFNAVLTLPMLITALVALSKESAGLWYFIMMPMSAISCVLTIYVFLQLKRLLIERYDIYNLNSIIAAMIFCSIIINVKNFLTAIFMVIFHNPGFVQLLDSIMGIPCFMLGGIIGIIFGVRLLGINDESSGLLRAYAILSIIASTCLVSVILILIAFFLSMVNNVILGILLLKGAETESRKL